MNKKAQTQGVVPIILMLVVGVGAAVLALIFIGTLGGQTYNLIEDDIDAIATNTVTAETFTANNATAQELNHYSIQSGTLVIYNVSSGLTQGLGNFTIDYDAGTVLLKGGVATENGSNLGANYTWGASEIRTSVKAGIINGFNALETTGNYVPIIVLAVIIALVLGLVMGFMVIGRQGGGSSL